MPKGDLGAEDKAVNKMAVSTLKVFDSEEEEKGNK